MIFTLRVSPIAGTVNRILKLECLNDSKETDSNDAKRLSQSDGDDDVER